LLLFDQKPVGVPKDNIEDIEDLQKRHICIVIMGYNEILANSKTALNALACEKLK
jgi:hypothetical protein